MEADYEEAMKWLESMKDEYDQEDSIINTIEYIKEVLWIDNDMRNS
ncbi:hypothetical protein UFOVP447_172 [uncultured Caudovirales phage]|uniref:Uncharacterized protein n=1 Tax=uncultured Caudovirales phage TaxID=2100421 RepID=A0A6J5MA47_9CAUD|nr:hypothetical protein UFOVP447_172 [uncultured Caudovirales phage]